MRRKISERRPASLNSASLAASLPLVFSRSAKTVRIESSIVRSAPPDNASLPEVMTTPFTFASAVVSATILSRSSITLTSNTFIDLPGLSQVTSAMPSASVSTLKFFIAVSLKAPQ